MDRVSGAAAQSPPPSPPARDEAGVGAWSLASLSDGELMQRIAQRQCDALAELYHRRAPSLSLLISRFLPSTEDTEEIVQEVFLHLWRQAGVYDPGRSSVSTWLALIARSRAIDRLRAQQTLERTLARAAQENRHPQSPPVAAAELLAEQRRRRLWAALAELPAEQRRVLVLAFYGGRTQAQIAQSDDIPLGTVKTRTVLGMKKLRRSLGSEGRMLF